MKTILMALALMAVIAALAGAGLFMLRGGSREDRQSNMARALAVRVGLSILLFVCILVAWKLGWIQPSGVPVGR